MTLLAAASSPAELLLNDLTPDSGLSLRRWTPDELRRQPKNGKYLSLTVYNEQDTLAPLAAPSTPMRVADLLPMVC